ncbi:MAG: hypothetical protein AB7P40_04295 [Chloroflexota bacterium]
MATFPLTWVRGRTASRTPGGVWSRARLGGLAACWLLAVFLLFSSGSLPRELRVRQIAAAEAFPLVDWHLARLAERSGWIVAGLLGEHPTPTAADKAAALAYFAEKPAARAPLAPAAEVAIERAVSDVLWQEGLTTAAPWTPTGSMLFPPVAFTFTSPPEVLVVARRDRIAVVQSELLKPGVSVPEAERMEAATDALGYSSLVVNIGGLATYPTMVLRNTAPMDAVVAVTHEWIHGYLFFTPLGQRYWSSQEARSINETTAEIVSQELGPRAARSLGLDALVPSGGGRPSAPSPSLAQFRTMMRETRVKLDAMLAAGQIDEAEAYLDARRLDFVAAGYQIRKLNQAYFAFNGSYGDAAAGVSPMPRQLRMLRAASSSPGEFLQRVGQLTSAADLARAVGE